MKKTRIISAVLLGSLCAAVLPVFAVSAAQNTSVKLDGKLDEAKNVHSYTVTDDGGKKKATFYAALTAEGNLYLACDAYHDVYLTSNESNTWHRNSNFEFWVNKNQGWVSAAGKGDKNAQVWDAKMVSTELKNADTKYHTVTEAIVNKERFTATDGIIKLGAAWKTPGDKLTSTALSINNDDWWHTPGAGDCNLFVSAAGLYENEADAKAATSAGLKYTAAASTVQSVDKRSKWLKDGKNYTLIDRGGLGNSFSYYGLGDSNKTVTVSADLQLGQYPAQEQAFLVGVGDIDSSDTAKGDIVNEKGSTYYLVDFRVNNNGTFNIGIERNEKDWGNWSKDVAVNDSFSSEATTNVKVTYKAGKIAVYLNNALVVTYVDENPLTGTGYGLASKTTNKVLKNVTAKEDGSAVATEIKTTIGSTTDFDNLIKAVNYLGKGHLAGQEIKLTADLDYTGKKFVPFNDTVINLNGDGHTISGISTTVKSAGSGNYGLIAKALTNGGGQGSITNLTLKDCVLTVKGATGAKVGGVVGFGDRGTVSDVKFENVIITVDGEAVVGALVGQRDWANGAENENGIKNVVFNKVTIDAPKATVGILVGKTGGDAGDGKAPIGTISGKVYVKSANENPAMIGEVATSEGKGFVVADTAKVEFATAPEAEVVTPDVPEPPKTGSAVVGLGVLAVISLAGVAVATKKRH